jgi:urease accessory protein UreE
MSDKIEGNEFVINPSRSQYDHDREYWQGIALKRAKFMNRGTVIVVDDEVVYRAWPERESVYKGIADE